MVVVSLSLSLPQSGDTVTVWVWVMVTGLVMVMESVIVTGMMADGRVSGDSVEEATKRESVIPPYP